MREANKKPCLTKDPTHFLKSLVDTRENTVGTTLRNPDLWGRFTVFLYRVTNFCEDTFNLENAVPELQSSIFPSCANESYLFI